jgi:hypothetical protein
MNPFLVFGVIAMAFAAVVVRHEPRAKALAITGFTFALLGVILERA